MADGRIPLMASRQLAERLAKAGRSKFASTDAARIGDAAEIALQIDEGGDEPLTRIADATERIAASLERMEDSNVSR